jgi:hypothetical protein
MKLRILAAAYEAALWYGRCPGEEKMVDYQNKIVTSFTEEEFRQGVMCAGLKAVNIAEEIIDEIASLKDAQELLKTYNRWRRGEDVTHIDPSEIGKAIDKLTL